MYKESIIAGVVGGVLFGVVQSLTMGPAGGFFVGLFFGVGISVLLHKFANSKTIKNQTQVSESDLLPGERVLLTKPANFVIEPKNFGLEDFAFGDLLWAVGMKNKESLGGALHLTNYRIIFRSHRFNRIRGMTSVFLPTIQRLENHTLLVFRKLTVTTLSAKVVFVVSDVDDVITQIASAQEQMDQATLAVLKSHATEYPDKCSDGLQSWDAMNRVNNLMNLGKSTADLAGVIANPLGALGSIFLSELLDRTLVEKWQQVFHSAEQHGAAGPHQRRAA